MSSWTGTDKPDVLAYVETALELLPLDPAQAGLDDLGRLAAMAEGLARLMLRLRADMAALARRALDDDLGGAELTAIAKRRNELDAQHARALRADERFDRYTAAALSAHGFDLDQLVAGD